MTTTWTKQIPWDEVLATLDALADAGWEKDAALDLVSKLIDDALPMDTLVPGPAGAALEAIDGPVLRATLGLLWSRDLSVTHTVSTEESEHARRRG